jgi:hypothetical protein
MVMVAAWSLWLPIIVSAVFVYLASTLIHMFTPWHRSDMSKLPQEDGVMDALRPFNIPPGDYGMPYGGSMAAMRDPSFIAKMKAGPVGIMTFFPSGPPQMGSSLVLWFLYTIVVGIFTAYVTGHVFGAGPGLYRAVFRIAGCTSFACYAMALPPFSIWYRRSWVTTVKSMLDGLLYGLLTAGTFGWLWPQS